MSTARQRPAESTTYTFLKMTLGSQAGANFLLDPDRANWIGRGVDCAIVLTDPLCSRTHSLIICENGQWQVRDGESRNGTYVNGQKVDEAVLAEGHYIKVGSTEFSFHHSVEPPTATERNFDPHVTQTLVKDVSLQGQGTGNTGLGALASGDPEGAKDLLLLYQLSIKLLSCSQPAEVIQAGLELLHERTHASIVGFLWVSDD